MEHHPWDYGVELHEEGNKIEVAFQSLPMADIMGSVNAVHDKPDQVSLKEKASPDPHPTYGLNSNTQWLISILKKK